MLTTRFRRQRRLTAALTTLVAVGGVATIAPSVASALSPTPTPFPYATVTEVLDVSGPAEGGNVVRLVGRNMNLLGPVWFGPEWKGTVTEKTATTATVIAPRGASGATVDVGGSPFAAGGWTAARNASTADDYTFDGPSRLRVTPTPDHGPVSGGNRVTLSGEGIDFSKAVDVGLYDRNAAWFDRSWTFSNAEIVERTATSVTVIVPWGRTKNDPPADLVQGHAVQRRGAWLPHRGLPL